LLIYDNIRYYIAECTGNNWATGWRVGECSGSLRQASCKVIPLEEREEWALGQVSASYSVLQPSAISLTASSNFITEGSTITLYGQLSPRMIDKSITIYFKTGGSPLDVLAVVKTDLNGKFFLQLECKGNWSFLFPVKAGLVITDTRGRQPIAVLTVMSGFFVAITIAAVAIVFWQRLVSLMWLVS
jgi:hypothetical protein